MRLSRRGWNNVIIIAVICFIAVVQLPELVKQRFGHEGETQAQPDMTALLPTQAEIDQLHLPLTSVNREDGSWLAHPRVALPADQLISHWQSLAGTAVSDEMVGKLKPTVAAAKQCRDLAGRSGRACSGNGIPAAPVLVAEKLAR